jgi:hypothetical protein
MSATRAEILLICILTILGLQSSSLAEVHYQTIDVGCWCRLTDDGGMTEIEVGGTGHGGSDEEACQDCHQNILNANPGYTIVNCDPCPPMFRKMLQIPYQATPLQPVPPISQWTVVYTCQTNGKPISFIATGNTFCEAFNTARKMVCERVKMRNLVCCKASFVIKQRPCDCCSCSATSNSCLQPIENCRPVLNSCPPASKSRFRLFRSR